MIHALLIASLIATPTNTAASNQPPIQFINPNLKHAPQHVPPFFQHNINKLKTCNPQLARLVITISLLVPLRVVECHRNKADQNKAYKQKKSKAPWPHSKHNQTPSLAVDIIPARFGYRSVAAFYMVADLMKSIGAANNMKIIWGGDWKMRDYSHFEIWVQKI